MANINFLIKRLEKATTENMIIKEDAGMYEEGQRRLIVENNNKIYTLEVAEEKIVKCSCQDFHYKCKDDEGKLAVCKHMIRASIELGLDL